MYKDILLSDGDCSINDMNYVVHSLTISYIVLYYNYMPLFARIFHSMYMYMYILHTSLFIDHCST